jgi:beta-glucosidase
VRCIRSNSAGPSAGITLNLHALRAGLAERGRPRCRARHGRPLNRWFLDPVFGRGYPDDVLDDHVRRGTLASAELPFVAPGDLATIAAPTDFLGVNYYTRAIRCATDLAEADNAPARWPPRDDCTDIGWESTRHGLSDAARAPAPRVRARAYYVTENGAAYTRLR